MKSISILLMATAVLLSPMDGFSKTKNEPKPFFIEITDSQKETVQNSSQFAPIFDGYFSIKDALIGGHDRVAATYAKNMSVVIKAVDMGSLSTTEHKVWMQVRDDLAQHAGAISTSRDISQQRKAFAILSKKAYELFNASKLSDPVYRQYCPMADNGNGASWLSRESAIKNPYYGVAMLTCGEVLEKLN